MGKIYVGDIGTIIKVDMQENLTGYVTAVLKVKKPNGALVEWTSSVDNHPTTGVLSVLGYIALEGDLNMRGVYKIQPYIEFATWKGRGTPVYLEVFGQYT
jgi:hypothetical protein